jgi:hypothetical protein
MQKFVRMSQFELSKAGLDTLTRQAQIVSLSEVGTTERLRAA